MKNHTRLLVSQCKYTKTPMSKFECFGHAVKGQCYNTLSNKIFNNNEIINRMKYYYKLVVRTSLSFFIVCSASAAGYNNV